VASVGAGGYHHQPAEAESKVFRCSIYFARNLPAGYVIGPDDIRRIRPGMGLAPKYFDELLGKKVVKDVSKGMPVSWELVLGA